MFNPSLASLIFTVTSSSTTLTLLFRSPDSPAKESHSSLLTRHTRLLLTRHTRLLPCLRKHLLLRQYSCTGSQTTQLSLRLRPLTTPSPPFSPSSQKMTSYILLLSTPAHFPLLNSTTTSTTRSSL